MCLDQTQNDLPSFDDLAPLILQEGLPTYKEVTGARGEINEVYIPASEGHVPHGDSDLTAIRGNCLRRICNRVCSIKKQFRPTYDEDELWGNV